MISLKKLKQLLLSCNCDGAAFFDKEGEIIISYRLNLNTAKKMADLIAVLISISNNFGGYYTCIKGTGGYVSVVDCGEFFVVLTSKGEIELNTIKKLMVDDLLSENCSGI